MHAYIHTKCWGCRNYWFWYEHGIWPWTNVLLVFSHWRSLCTEQGWVQLTLEGHSSSLNASAIRSTPNQCQPYHRLPPPNPKSSMASTASFWPLRHEDMIVTHFLAWSATPSPQNNPFSQQHWDSPTQVLSKSKIPSQDPLPAPRESVKTAF